MRIAVYGTLRRGFSNYGYLLGDQEFLGEETVSLPYKMVSLGGFPGLVASEENHDVVIEVFKIDEEAARSVDRLESYPRFYNRTEIVTSFDVAWIYYLNNPEGYNSNKEVPGGDWKKFKNSIKNIYELLS